MGSLLTPGIESELCNSLMYCKCVDKIEELPKSIALHCKSDDISVLKNKRNEKVFNAY